MQTLAALPIDPTVAEGRGATLEALVDRDMCFGVESWDSGVDRGKDAYKSSIVLAIWNARKEVKIAMPYHQRVVQLKPPPDA
jgi:hypothetical protein